MKSYSVREKLMGSAFELLIVHPDAREAEELLRQGIEEITRIEKLLSEFLPEAETTKINHHSSKEPLVIDEECYKLIERSKAISGLTRGCFDISVGPLKKLYNFKNIENEFPSEEAIQNTLKQVGYQKINLKAKDHAIQLNQPGMSISFAAIGKGYASDRVKQLWQDAGVASGYINASGDLNAFGRKADGTSWTVGIANPNHKDDMLLYVPVEEASVATSGDYEQYFLYNGKRYSHNINPHTGYPLTGIKSVSVFSPSAELSDALATAVYVMGTKQGVEFVNQLPQTHAIIIDDQDKMFLSKNLMYEKA